MTSYLYKPGHPFANERGFVTKSDFYYHEFMTTEDKRAMIGNQVIELQFISDTMEPTRHMVDGKIYTSKKKFRNETKARGCIEVGNDYKKKPSSPPKALSRRERREDIKKALYQVRNGRDIVKEIRSLPND